MSVDADLAGVWSRRSLTVGGTKLDNVPAFWLQAGVSFVDVRPGPPEIERTAFSGRIKWRAPQIEFLRDIDLSPAPTADKAELRRTGPNSMVEYGVFQSGGRTVAFEEEWERQPHESEVKTVFEFRSGARLLGRLVRIGASAALVAVEPAKNFSCGILMSCEDSVWRIRSAVGTIEAPDEPVAVTGEPVDWACTLLAKETDGVKYESIGD